MLKSRLFWKVFTTLVVTSALSIAALVHGLLSWQEARALSQSSDRLQSAAVLFSESFGSDLNSAPNDDLQRRIMRLGSDAGLRFTLINAKGEVIADSQCSDVAAVASLENHSTRPEVIDAMAHQSGTGRRMSASVGQDFAYYARQVKRDGATIGVVRVAMPVALIKQELASLRRVVLLYGSLVFVAILAISYLVSTHLVQPVLTLNQAAKAIIRGEYGERAFVTNHDELGALAESFNRLSHVLGKQFAELRESDERQALVLGGMIEGVIAIDRDERVVFANGAACRLFGVGATQVEGRPLLDVVRNHSLHRAVGVALESGEPQRLEIEWKGVELLTLAVQLAPLPGRRSQGAVLVVHDTTELRRLENIRQDFVANVSHELKTPLSSIKAYTETLLNGALNDEAIAPRFLQRIDEQADRLTALIQDLLSLARIESEQQQFDIISVVVSEAVAASLNDYRPLAEAKQIELSAESSSPDLCVKADAEGLRVILNNLVDNAIKYTPPRGRVTVRWEAVPGNLVRLEVEDSGIGIPHEQLLRVFERFYRVDKARSRELGGTGLGLSIVKHLAQSFGGSVQARSELGAGTTFSITLSRG